MNKSSISKIKNWLITNKIAVGIGCGVLGVALCAVCVVGNINSRVPVIYDEDSGEIIFVDEENGEDEGQNENQDVSSDNTSTEQNKAVDTAGNSSSSGGSSSGGGSTPTEHVHNWFYHVQPVYDEYVTKYRYSCISCGPALSGPNDHCSTKGCKGGTRTEEYKELVKKGGYYIIQYKHCTICGCEDHSEDGRRWN